MNKRLILIIGIFMILMFTTGITYSVFNTQASLATNDQKIAGFIFNAEQPVSLELPVTDLKPGDNNNYLFSVTNTDSEYRTMVDIEYQIIIKTYHFIPLVINLYQIKTDEEELIGKCDESYSRNEENELVCTMPTSLLTHNNDVKNDYRLYIEFPSEYDSESYSGLMDYLDVELKSWQYIED